MGKHRFKYTPSDLYTDDSEYESDGGTKYKEKKILGAGTYAQAREFRSTNELKQVAILSPRKLTLEYYQDFHAKFNFFKTIYPNAKVELIKQHNFFRVPTPINQYIEHTDFRLVLPLIPGKAYKELKDFSQEQQIQIFISAIHALREAHQRGYVVLDIKSDNIHYDATTNRSYLIDGGLATKIANPLPSLFQCATKYRIIKNQREFWHIAPECWGTSRNIANTSMDIYSLAIMLHHYVFRKHVLAPGLYELLTICESMQPQNRPTLDKLEAKLEILHQELLSTEDFHYA